MSDIADLLDKIRDAPSTRALWALVVDYYHAKGATMISYHAVNPDASDMAIATDGFPAHWVEEYTQNNFVEIDPIPELASKMARPFYWHEIRDLTPLSAANLRYLNALENSGIGDGLAFYVFGPVLQNAYVGLGFGQARIDLDPHVVFELQCVAQAGHLRFCTLSATDLPDKRLSKREREVLEWVARGKSNTVIADILSISAHTVDAHMRSIYRKLDVSDRTSAAVRGIGNGILHYSG
ncbi:MAG: LuxR family transcriptional regulator [Pseudomonadota bacterium]